MNKRAGGCILPPRMIRTLLHLLAACLWLASGAARAQLTIEITGGGGNQIPVAVLQFAGEAVLPTSITDMIGTVAVGAALVLVRLPTRS